MSDSAKQPRTNEEWRLLRNRLLAEEPGGWLYRKRPYPATYAGILEAQRVHTLGAIFWCRCHSDSGHWSPRDICGDCIIDIKDYLEAKRTGGKSVEVNAPMEDLIKRCVFVWREEGFLEGACPSADGR